jgi:hypothetical protein
MIKIKLYRLNEFHPGAKEIEETIYYFINIGIDQGISEESLLTAMDIFLKHEKGEDFRRIRKGSELHNAILNIENCIETIIDDGYPEKWIYRVFEKILKQEDNMKKYVFKLDEMAIIPRDEMPERPIEIDLSGPQGNAFYLIGLARKLFPKIYPDVMEEWREFNKTFDFTGAKAKSPVDEMVEDMMSGDYDHLLKVFDDLFGDYVILYK